MLTSARVKNKGFPQSDNLDSLIIEYILFIIQLWPWSVLRRHRHDWCVSCAEFDIYTPREICM